MRIRVGAIVGATALTACLWSNHASAASQDSPASGEFIFNPLGLLFGNYNAEVGIGVAEVVSVNVSGSYFDLGSGSVDVTGFSGGIGVQLFLTRQLYNGWYVYPNVQYINAHGTSSDEEADLTAFGGGALGGYQWDWKPFTLRLGAGFVVYSASATGDDIEVGFSGVSPAADLSLGVSF